MSQTFDDYIQKVNEQRSRAQAEIERVFREIDIQVEATMRIPEEFRSKVEAFEKRLEMMSGSEAKEGKVSDGIIKTGQQLIQQQIDLANNCEIVLFKLFGSLQIKYKEKSFQALCEKLC